MKHKYAFYPLIMGILAFLCFLGVACVLTDTVQPLWGRILLLLLPALILWTVGIFAAKGKLNHAITVTLTTMLTILLLLVSMVYTFCLVLWTATTQTTDIRYYTAAYDVIEEEEGVKGIFPPAIPADAKDIEFMYMPQFLQGGEVFELSYSTTAAILFDWTERLKEEAVWCGPDKEWRETHNRTGGTDALRIQLYWDGGYNHGEISYVLIDTNAERITFYYSHW